MPELESLIEQKLIEQLIYGDSQWTYRPDLKTEADLWNNFKYILEQNNKDRLDGEPLSDSEFEQVKNQLQFSTFYKAGPIGCLSIKIVDMHGASKPVSRRSTTITRSSCSFLLLYLGSFLESRLFRLLLYEVICEISNFVSNIAL
jgi:hypothetical protein